MDSDLLEYFSSFNRKERFHLIGQFLGNQNFSLDSKVLHDLCEMLSIDTPDNYFSAMDYHLDWIYASLELAYKGNTGLKWRDELCVSGTQEDVDFLIVFKDKQGVAHIVMIEAKGATSFINNQLKSKSDRLKAIFGVSGSNWSGVIPHFLVCSPRESAKIDTINMPDFMLNESNDGLIWFKLHMPIGLQKVTRCDEQGRPSTEGKYWMVR